MQRSDFYFDLPPELIAQSPLAERTASRLMVLDGETGSIHHRQFTDVIDLLAPEDLLVFNNTKVLPARLYGVKQTGGRVEVLLERIRADGSAVAHVRASKSPKPGSCILVTPDEDSDVTDFALRVLDREGALFVLKPEEGEWPELLRENGHMPLPPYIERPDTAEDQERYQTVFAKREGAVAAPTAGLHFDQHLLADIRAKGIEFAEVTLHVGAGTFQPVRAENIADHHMHSEYIEVPQATVDAVAACRDRGGRVIAVGTTAVRSLESAALFASCSESGAVDEGQGGSPAPLPTINAPNAPLASKGVSPKAADLAPYYGDSDIFIYPGKPFRAVDAMITNFHLPESTLIMLVSAFAGREHVLHAYAEAVRNRYRFFSYGDAMFITPSNAVMALRGSDYEI